MSPAIEQTIRSRVLSSGLDAASIEYFSRQAGNPKAQSIIDSNRIKVNGLQLHNVADIAAQHGDAIDCLKSDAFGLVVLNGGMATRFGGVAKGTVEISDGISFLGAKLLDALKLAERHGAQAPPVFLMCSSATNAATQAHLRANGFFGYPSHRVFLFNQCESVRFTPHGAIFRDADGQPSYHGTGHGDLPYCIRNLPVFQRFGERGRVMLLSNVDNVLATADLNLMGDFLRTEESITVELVDKNPGDVGGGPLVLDGRAQLVEAFRLPEDFDHGRVPVFNTNTFWLEPTLFLDQDVELPWHRVQKKVGDQPVVQFERLVGELTASASTRFIRVERNGLGSRFLAVKTPNDLENNRGIIMKTWRSRLK